MTGVENYILHSLYQITLFAPQRSPYKVIHPSFFGGLILPDGSTGANIPALHPIQPSCYPFLVALDQNLNLILKEMWRLDEKASRGEALTPEESDFYDAHLGDISRYYEKNSRYWSEKEKSGSRSR